MELSPEAKREIEKMVIKAVDRIMDAALDHAKETIGAVGRRVTQLHDQAVALTSMTALKAINGADEAEKKQ